MRKRMLLVGVNERPEWAGIAEWLRERCDLLEMASPADVVAAHASLPAPDLIAVAQSFPGQWSHEAYESLHRCWPLARLVVLLGSWCEGELRTDRPCPGLFRIFWHDFLRRLGEVLDDSVGLPGSWNLPRAASEVERLLYDLNSVPRANAAPRRGRVVIAAATRAAWEPLADACRAGGWEPVPFTAMGASQRAETVAGIFDVHSGSELEWRQMGEFAETLRPARVVIVLGFPRVTDAERVSQWGAALLAKPFRVSGLWRELAAGHRASVTIARTVKAV